jgi:hypothetical protein
LWLALLIIPILAGLLGAVQLLPLAELSQFSNRGLSLTEAAEYAVIPVQLIVGLLLPSAEGGHELVIYLGLVPLLLAPFGVTKRNRWSWFYGILFVFSILFALGASTPVHSWFYYVVPGFRWVRTPARIFFVAALALAALVGFAIDNLAQKQWSPTAISWLTRLAVAVGTLALLIGLGLALGFGQTGRATLALAILIPIGLGFIVLWARGLISTTVTAALLGILLFLDLASFDMSLMRFVSSDEAFAPGRPAADYLAQKQGLYRVYSPSYSLPMQTAAAAGLQLADGVEPVHLAGYDQFMARAGGYEDASFSVTIPNFGSGSIETALREVEPNLKLLGLLNVEYLAAAFPMNWPGLTPEAEIEGTFIYRNDHSLPRAWVTHQTALAETDWLTQLESLADLSNVAIIDNGPTLTGSSNSATPAIITGYSTDLIELKTEIAEPGWLVLSEIWYPGWQATINADTPQAVAKVNGVLRGVYLNQPGEYQIRVEYRPGSVIFGGWITILTIAGLGLAILIIMIVGKWRVPQEKIGNLG